MIEHEHDRAGDSKHRRACFTSASQRNTIVHRQLLDAVLAHREFISPIEEKRRNLTVSMTESEADIKSLAHAHFRDAFGKPQAQQGRDDPWTFEPRSRSASVRVVLSDSPLAATLYVTDLDPGKPQAVSNAAIRSREDVGRVIALLQRRLRVVTRPPQEPSALLEGAA